MPTVADSVDAVVGGDTHVDTTSLCVASPVGAVLAEITIENDEAGYAQAVTWVLQTVPTGAVPGRVGGHPQLRRGVVPGAGGRRDSGGRGRAALPRGAGPAGQVRRRGRVVGRQQGVGDARRTGCRQPRTGDGVREALRLLAVDREQMTTQRTRLDNQLLADLLTGTAEQQAMRKKDLTSGTLRKLAGARGRAGRPVDEQARLVVLRRKAQDIVRLDQQIRENERQLRTILGEVAPQLLEQVGVGPVVAAQLIVSYSHHGRCRDEAAFAALAGVSPVEASSGRITRHRLNRGGDRRLNRALHIVAVTRVQARPAHPRLHPAAPQGPDRPGDPPHAQALHRPHNVQDPADHRRPEPQQQQHRKYRGPGGVAAHSGGMLIPRPFLHSCRFSPGAG